MKQKFIMAIMTVFVCCYANRIHAENRVDWGMNLAMDVEIPGKWKGENHSVTMFSPGIGTSIGGVCNLYLGKGFYFEPGVSLFYSSYKYKDLVIPDAAHTSTEEDPKVTKYGLQIPLMFGYEINISDKFGLDVYTGPQIRYAFAGKVHFKNKAIQEEVGEFFDLWKINRRFDCSWKIGIGVPLINNCRLSLEADLGITDLLKEDMSFRENRVGLKFTKFF